MAKLAPEKDYLEVDLARILQAFWRRAWMIVLSTLLVGAMFFGYSAYIITPTYTASAMLYVNNSSVSFGNTAISISAQELTAAQSLVNTYVIILNSRSVLEEVIEETGVPYTYEQMEEMISAAPVNSTEVFEVTVKSTDPQEAELIANSICHVLPGKIAKIIEGSSVCIVDYAVVPVKKSAPNVTEYTAVGMVVGMVLSCGVILILEIFDKNIRSEDYLLQTFADVPVLAVIPDLDNGSAKDRYYYSSRTKRE